MLQGKRRHSLLLLAVCLGLLATLDLRADDQERLFVGKQKDGRIVVPTNQVLRPAGKQITFPGRPVDLALTDDGQTLVIKNMRDLLFLDVASAKVQQKLAVPKGGFSVVGLLVRGDRVFVSDTQNSVHVARRQAGGKYAWDKAPLAVPAPKKGAAYPAGLAFGGKNELWVANSRGNSVQRIDLRTGKVEQTIPVGVAPFTAVFPRPTAQLDKRLLARGYVSNWGGDHPRAGDPKSTTSGTPVRVDPRTRIANDGTLSVLSQVGGAWKQIKTIRVGLHPSGMALSPDRHFLYVANANSDTVSVVDTRNDTVVETIACRPEARLPFGSGCNALAVSPDGKTLFVANGTNNCLAVVQLGTPGKAPSKVLGLIPTGWYPGAVLLSADGKKLFVANIKGHGSLSQPRAAEKGKNSHDHLGSVSILDVPDARVLARYTREVNENNRLAYSIAGLEKPRRDVAPVPVPARHGEPSVFKHVIYIIKENRTYDQVFGDMKEGKGEPKLCIFGEKVTPNHHALAREFTLFDNFYCSGVLSADGHSWANAAYVTDYLERAFGGFTRSYPYDGGDALAFPATGFLWDNALAHKKTIRNYGEFVAAENYFPKGTTWLDFYNDYKNKTRKVKVKTRVTFKSLEPYTHPTFPHFPLHAPDVYRAQVFLDEFRQFEKKGEMPNLIYMALPCDHTNGTRPGWPTPRAMVADNDLALGQIVEAVSKSKFWKDTCIFVVEDDPQDGFDHVDSHRTVALVISPYTRRKFVDSTCYNQTGMIKTIEPLLGLPPMNQMDLSATAMRKCFQNRVDLTAYRCRTNRIALDEMNKPLKALKGMALHWAKKSLELNLDEVDAADEDTFNRILWHSVRGDELYPAKYAGRK